MANRKSNILYSLYIIGFCLFALNVYAQQGEFIVDIFNFFQKTEVDTLFEEISFVNNDTCLLLTEGENGDFYCDYLTNRIIMYYPDNYNIVFLLCDSLTDKDLYVYINNAKYLVRPQKKYALYSLSEFLTRYLYLRLQSGDQIYSEETPMTIQNECIFEIIGVRGEYLEIREVLYNETHTPRINAQPNSSIFLYRWRDGNMFHTERLVIDD